MALFQKLGQGAGYLKAGLYGNAGSGKTHTATLIGVGLKRDWKLPGPILYFDTETGSEYVNPLVREGTGEDALAVKSRVFSDAVAAIQEAEKLGGILIIDSVTHIWEELKKSYVDQLNKRRVDAGKSPKPKLEFQDIDNLKKTWNPFTELYLNSKVHIILCGRLGNVWEFETNEDGKRELIKTATKMKTESELGYEPSLLCEMERVQDTVNGKLTKEVMRRCTVMKDRFRVLDGKQFDNPTYETFKPHIAFLKPGAVNSVDTTRQTQHEIDTEGADKWEKEKRQRVIFCEEIQGILTQSFPGQSAAEKKAKVDLLEKAFGTRSWTAVENLDSKKLKEGKDKLPDFITVYNSETIKSAEKALQKAGKE